jgi:catalase
LGGGCPFAAPDETAYVHPPREVSGPKIKLRPASFDDHYTQATLFYRSLTPVEQEHLAGAFSFELAKCTSPGIHARMVSNLAQVDGDLAEQVAAHLGIDVPVGTPQEPALVSPALSLDRGEPTPVEGRVVALLVDDATTTRTVSA